MQVNEVYRRGVVLAKTPQALQELLANDVRPDSDVIHTAIPDSLFSMLWESRLFTELNEVCGTNLDDYEEELLPPEGIAAAEGVLRARKNASSGVGEVQSFCEKLLAMLQDAGQRKYPLLFVL